MRSLTDEETTLVFEKLVRFIGKDVEKLINRPDGTYCFRYHQNKVFYLSESIMKQISNIGKENLLSMGTCVGRFTHSKKFRVGITFLDYLTQNAKYKVWIKPSAEMGFLYGNSVAKSGLARITEGTPQYAGVVVYNMSEIPLGFGVAAQATQYCKDLEATAAVVLHQADIGAYVREENSGLI
mmetsp:Transcript_1207/g.1883  ORF Transcript_1207/g.1883 Transcript_1207/m.1883 type:complete len:182 (+) Transcript_1207:60-605(+)